MSVTVVKTTRKHLENVFMGLLLSTFYTRIRAGGCQNKYQADYYQLKQIGKRKINWKRIQKDWIIEQLAPYLKNCRQIYIVGDDTQTNHPNPKIQAAD